MENFQSFYVILLTGLWGYSGTRWRDGISRINSSRQARQGTRGYLPWSSALRGP